MTFVPDAFIDDPVYKGTSILAMGRKGSGKSSLLHMWGIKAFAKGHTVILRSKDIDTWYGLASEYPLHVYTPDFYSWFRFPVHRRFRLQTQLLQFRAMFCPTGIWPYSIILLHQESKSFIPIQ